jgi:hypothetical protein
MKCYQTVFNREALRFVVQADAGVFREIESWVNRIERAPATRGDYVEVDSAGRELQVAVLQAVAITYWTDDAARRNQNGVRLWGLWRSRGDRTASASPWFSSTLTIALPVPTSAAPEIRPAQIGSQPSTQNSWPLGHQARQASAIEPPGHSRDHGVTVLINSRPRRR